MLTYLASRLVCDILAFIYPAYASFKAIKSREMRDIVAWQMYWIVMGFFSALETMCDIFVFWLPFYYELKLCFVIWLIMPQTRGYIVIYRHFIHPWLEKHEKVIDDALVDAQARAVVASADLGKKGFDLLIRSLNSSPLPPKSDTSDVDENITIIDKTSNISPQTNLAVRKEHKKNHERYQTAQANLGKTAVTPGDVIDKLMKDMKGKDYLR